MIRSAAIAAIDALLWVNKPFTTFTQRRSRSIVIVRSVVLAMAVSVLFLVELEWQIAYMSGWLSAWK